MILFTYSIHMVLHHCQPTGIPLSLCWGALAPFHSFPVNHAEYFQKDLLSARDHDFFWMKTILRVKNAKCFWPIISILDAISE